MWPIQAVGQPLRPVEAVGCAVRPGQALRPQEKRAVMSAAASAHEIVRVMSQLAARGSSLCVASLAGAAAFKEWRHYPANDAVDAVHGTEFYYHAHSANERLPDEHGHFHVFVRPRSAKNFHHIVAISLNAVGLPTRLFLTNQWVTGESWVSAQRMTPLVTGFECRLSGRLSPVASWITAMVRVYREEILSLHEQREAWSLGSSAAGVSDTVKHTKGARAMKRGLLSDQRFHVIAEQNINLPKRLVTFG
jgi:hypothetical protein